MRSGFPPRSDVVVPCLDLVEKENAGTTKKNLFLPDGIAIITLEKPDSFLIDGREHTEDLRAVQVPSVNKNKSMMDRNSITDLWSRELSKTTEFVTWMQKTLNEKIYPDLYKVTETDTIDSKKGSKTEAWPQIASPGSDGTRSNRFQMFVKAPTGKTTLLWALATDSVTDLKQNIANHI